MQQPIPVLVPFAVICENPASHRSVNENGAALSALAPLFGTFWGNTDLIPFLLPSPQELGSKSGWPGFRLAKAVGSPA